MKIACLIAHYILRVMIQAAIWYSDFPVQAFP